MSESKRNSTAGENTELRYLLTEGVSVERRASAEGKDPEPYIIGYGVVFNKDSRIIPDWSGGFIERVLPESVSGLKMDEVVATINHDFDKILARVDSNTLKLTVDKTGIKYEFKAPDTTYGRDLVVNVENGNIKGSSFMFRVKTDRWTIKESETEPDLREILEIKEIIEMGPVVMPAYPDTTAAKRSYDSALKTSEQTEAEQRDKSEKEEIEKRLARLVKKYNYEKAKQ